MADRVKTIALACLALLSGAAFAQMADPTRPAVEAITLNNTPAVEGTAGNAGLQSIIRRNGGKPAALINGSVVELGGKAGDTRLVKIGDDFVVLRGPLGEETLRLTPAVEKKSIKVGKETNKGKQKK